MDPLHCTRLLTTRALICLRTMTQASLLTIMLGAIMTPVQADTLRKIADTGVVTFGYRESSVPFSYLDGPHKPIGFGVDMYAAVLQGLRNATGRQQITVRYQALTSQNRIPLIANGTVDLECGSTSNTAARAKTVAFAIDYFYTGPRLLVKKDSGITDFGDLRGKTIAITTGTTSFKLMRQFDLDHTMGMNLLAGKDHADSFLLLESGRAAAFVMDDILLYGQVLNARRPAELQVVGNALQVEPYACMLRKDDPAFKQVVDAAIAGLMQSGEFERLYDKWFMQPIPPRGRSLNLPMSRELRDNLQLRSDRPAGQR